MRTSLTIVALLIFTAVAAAQQAVKPPFEWKVSGDTVENFRMEFVANHAPDQTTPEGTVLAYAAFSDNRTASANMMKVVGDKWNAAVRRSLAKYEKKLLTPGAIQAIDDNLNEDEVTNNERILGPTKVTGRDVAGGGVRVLTSQAFTLRQRKSHDDPWKESKGQLKRRFTCVQGGDGLWRITKIEQEAQGQWAEDRSMLLYILYAQKLAGKTKTIPAIDTSTPKAAANSLFESLLARRKQLDDTVHAKGLDGWLKMLKPLFDDAYVKAQDEQAAQWVKQQAEPAPREVESVKDGDDGLKVVRLKPRDKWTGSIELRVKRTDDGWRVASAAFQELGQNPQGKLGWKTIQEPNLYNLAGR